MSLLEARGVAVAYGDAPAVWDVSLDVGEGELVAVIGPNGAGKTTLVNTIAGLLRARGGTLRFAGADLTAEPPHLVCGHGIALVPEGRRLFVHMTVEENLEIGCYRTDARRRREETLARVYALFPILGARRRQRAGSLSGGQQQMVAIGRALMTQPRLLILDEPSLGLAPRVVHSIFETLQEIARSGVAIFLAEQNVRAALTLARRACILEAGRVTREAPSAVLLDDPDVRRAYLGPLA